LNISMWNRFLWIKKEISTRVLRRV